jgi:hypothetical protein
VGGVMEKYFVACIIVVTIAAILFVFTQLGAGDGKRELLILNGTGSPMVLTENASARDPSMAELLAFLADDSTELHPAVKYYYMCADYARQLHDNAEALGIRAGVVSIRFNTTYHAADYFVADGCIVIVDDSSGVDKFARAVVGEPYMTTNVSMPDSYSVGDWDRYGVVKDIIYY